MCPVFVARDLSASFSFRAAELPGTERRDGSVSSGVICRLWSSQRARHCAGVHGYFRRCDHCLWTAKNLTSVADAAPVELWATPVGRTTAASDPGGGCPQIHRRTRRGALCRCTVKRWTRCGISSR